MQRPIYQGAMPPPPPPGQMMAPSPGMRPPGQPVGPPQSPVNIQRPPANFQGQLPPGAGFQSPQRYPNYAVRMAQPGTPQQVPFRPMAPSTPNAMMVPGGKRPMPNQSPLPMNKAHNGPPNTVAPGAPNPSIHSSSKKKKRPGDKILPLKVRDLVPESSAYMDLLNFEKKLDFTLLKKKFDIQEALKKPLKQKRTLRVFISNNFTPKKDGENGEEPIVPSWELRVEGRLLDEKGNPESSTNKNIKRKFSSFFKSLVIELDQKLYGPDNHVVEWHRNQNTAETDGFQVKRPGDKNVACKIFLLLDYQPPKYKLDPRLARVLGMHSGTRAAVYSAFWEYIKKNQLQDPHEKEITICDQYLESIFGIKKMLFSDLPSRLSQFLHPTDPIIIEHLINPESANESLKSLVCTDIEVELEDNVKQHMNGFLHNLQSTPDILQIDQRIDEIVESINQLKASREFYLGFALDPIKFINKWLASQSRDLKIMTGQPSGNPEEERSAEFFYEPWTQEAVPRYFYSKMQQRRAELEQLLGIRN